MKNLQSLLQIHHHTLGTSSGVSHSKIELQGLLQSTHAIACRLWCCLCPCEDSERKASTSCWTKCGTASPGLRKDHRLCGTSRLDKPLPVPQIVQAQLFCHL